MAKFKTKYCTGLERNCPADPVSGYIHGEELLRTPYPMNSVGLAVTNEDAHTGDYSLKISGTEIDVVSSMKWYYAINYASYHFGFWYKPSLVYGSNDETCVFTVRGSSGWDYAKVYWNEDGTIYFQNYYGGILGSDPGHPAGEWIHVGVRHYSNSGTGTLGFSYLYINGKPIVEFQGYTAPSDGYTLREFFFGSYPRDAGRNQGTPIGAFYDDMQLYRGYWSDNAKVPVEDSRFLDIVPDGPGHYSGWAPTPPSMDLYDAVDDVQTGTQYTPNIWAWKADQKALFTMQNIAFVEDFDIPSVMVKWSIKRDVTTPYWKYTDGIRTAGLDVFTSSLAPPTSYTLYYRDRKYDAQINNWTKASVNAMELGFKSLAP